MRPVGDIYEEYMTPPSTKEGYEVIKAVKVTLKVVAHEFVKRYVGDPIGAIVPIVQPISHEYV